MTVAIIGSGNVAWHLGHAFYVAGVQVKQICSRNEAEGKSLADLVQASYINHVDELDLSSDLILTAVSDDAIVEVLAPVPSDCSAMMVHTSGAISVSVLERFSEYGVFYPLQSLSKHLLPSANGLPLLITVNSEKTRLTLSDLAMQISNEVRFVTDAQRLIYHVCGVFSNNFVNYLNTISSDLLETNNLDFEMLLPLIQETALKLRSAPPEEVQTGPAKRNDREAIAQHEQVLKDQNELLDIYRSITEQIIKRYHQN